MKEFDSFRGPRCYKLGLSSILAENPKEDNFFEREFKRSASDATRNRAKLETYGLYEYTPPDVMADKHSMVRFLEEELESRQRYMREAVKRLDAGKFRLSTGFVGD